MDFILCKERKFVLKRWWVASWSTHLFLASRWLGGCRTCCYRYHCILWYAEARHGLWGYVQGWWMTYFKVVGLSRNFLSLLVTTVACAVVAVLWWKQHLSPYLHPPKIKKILHSSCLKPGTSVLMSTSQNLQMSTKPFTGASFNAFFIVLVRALFGASIVSP